MEQSQTATPETSPAFAPPAQFIHKPVAASERLPVLDVMRGFALLGIFLVNMQFFATPFMTAMSVPDRQNVSRSELLAWMFVKVFCEFKFISMFSMLFGIGLVVQMNRANAAGRPFMPVYLRRLGVLAVIGLLHGLFLWYGDILFLYSTVGVILLLCRNLSAKTMLIAAIAIVAITVFLHAGLVAIGMIAHHSWQQEQASSDESAPSESLSMRLATDESAFFAEEPAVSQPDGSFEQHDENGVRSDPKVDGEIASPRRGFAAVFHNPNPGSDEWMSAETRAYREGPFLDAFAFRSVSYAYALLAAIFTYGWRVLAMFLIGAALMKLHFFRPDKIAWQRRMAIVGILVGVPLELFYGMYTEGQEGHSWLQVGLAGVHELGSYSLCLGYVGLIAMIVHSGLFRPLTNCIACVGRMSMSNYLSQTVITTFIMYWWGLGMFGEVSLLGQVTLALCIYSGQVLLSVLWLKVFSIGPAEWLWRSATYGRFQPVLRRS